MIEHIFYPTLTNKGIIAYLELFSYLCYVTLGRIIPRVKFWYQTLPIKEYCMKRLLALIFATISSLLFWNSCSQKEQDIPVAFVTLSQPAAEMIIGEFITLKATISPSNATEREIMWASSKQSVASVDQTGKVVSIAEGTSTITATAGGKLGSCVVTVSKGVVEVSSINFDKTGVSLKVGETVTLTATVKPDDATDKTVTWSTSDASVATVSDGVVTAIKLGSATIRAKAGDKEATCAITVEATPVTSVTLDQTSASLKVGETVSLTATVKPDDATDKSVTWSSSNTSVATVSSSGIVTAIKAGSATITVKTNDGGKTATCSVTVKAATVPVTGVSLNTTSLSLTEGETQTLTATVSPSNATDKSVTWSSNNTSVATVSSTGVVTAKSAGSAIIMVTTKDGSKTATCSVTVKAKTVSVTGVSLDYTSLTMTEGETQTLTATISPSNATDKSVTWSSSNTSVATVSSAGVVTAKAAGTVTITVKTNDGNKTATCIVTVQEEKPSYYHIISSAEELIAFRNYINNGGEEQNGRLTADITLSNTWQGIGTESQPFSGIFDGNGHSVSGLSCQSSYSGLFGVVKNATIHNLTVSGSFSNGQYMGGIAGIAISSTIDNCQSSINISSGSYLGGIVGSSENCTISNCAHTENTIGNTSSNKVGGIAGQTSSQTEIYNCYNAGRIYGSDCFGGIVGYNGGNCSITNCYNKAAFKDMYYIDTGGGIVGYNCGRIVNCYSSGSMTCKTINGDMGMKNCGGVVGYNHTDSSCYCCYFLQQSPINNGLSFVGDLNWGSCSKCGPFNASGLFSSSSLSYSGNTTYLRTSLNQWVSSNQTSDNKYKRWRTDQSWPDFVQ